MTLIWEVGTSLHVIFIIHAMSRRPRCIDATRSAARRRSARQIAISPADILINK